MNQKQYIAEKIGQDYKRWNNEGIIISSGTNTGKTTFICDTLIPYALEQGKNVLYLVNRKDLYEKVKSKIKGYPNSKLLTYQAVQALILKGELIPHYDYIIADECHYFFTDALFNHYTDVSYDWLINQHENVVVYITATGNSIFPGLIITGIVKPDRQYCIPNDYSQIEAVYFYDKKQISEIIEDIRQQKPNDKILVFVNSLDRLKEMYCIYGDKANYLASKANVKDRSLSFIDYDCIKDMQFSKKILFVTKVMDNGIDLKDERIKHIFCEIIDTDSAIQAIGRKRPLNQNDTYSIYFMRYSNRAIRRFADYEEQNLFPVQKLMHDPDGFMSEYGHDRELLRRNKILYGEMISDGKAIGTIHINHRVRQKFEKDVQIYNKMISDGYEKVFLNLLGEPFKPKVKVLQIETVKKDLFLDYLKSITNTKLFKPEQKILKDKFRKILGLNDRYMGLNTLNGKLKDCGYLYTIVSERETCGENKFKRYWQVCQSGEICV